MKSQSAITDRFHRHFTALQWRYFRTFFSLQKMIGLMSIPLLLRENKKSSRHVLKTERKIQKSHKIRRNIIYMHDHSLDSAHISWKWHNVKMPWYYIMMLMPFDDYRLRGQHYLNTKLFSLFIAAYHPQPRRVTHALCDDWSSPDKVSRRQGS